jgi:hypothetical protein
MDELSRATLDVLRTDEKIYWVSEQLVASFSEGISHSAKDTDGTVQRDFIDVMALTPRERTKREKYEMSRPYDENEKLDLVRFALQEVFVTLPAMQNASAKALRELGSSASMIEFTAPDEEERQEGSYMRKLVADVAIEELKKRVDAFCERLTP